MKLFETKRVLNFNKVQRNFNVMIALLTCILLLGSVFPAVSAQGSDGETVKAADAKNGKMISLTELVPTLTPVSDYSGDFWERYTLFGDFGGARQRLYDDGVAFDATLTQVYQGVASGGINDDEYEYQGLLEYGLTLDTGKLGWWPGGLLVSNIYSSFGDTVLSDTGNIAPVNFNSILPDADPSKTAAMEYYLTQALPTKTVVTVGRINAANFLDRSRFANDRKTQFLNASLGNNLMVGNFVSFSTYAVLVDQPINKNLTVYGAVFDSALQPNESSPDGGLFSDIGAGVGADIEWEIGDGLKGSINPVFIYSNKDTAEVDNPYYQLSPLEDLLIPINASVGKPDNYAVIATLDQYLWTPANAKSLAEPASGPKPAADYTFQEPGVGLSLRAGYGPEDRNPWNIFLSAAIGGRGVIPGRPYDRFGLGVYSMILSDDYDDLILIGDILDDETGFEVFYNFAITPALQISINAQWIEPGIESTDDTWVLGSRLFTRF